MTLNLTKENRIYKKLFPLKLPQRDGIVLNVHHTNKNAQKIRFINGSFNKSGQVLALADIEGNIFLIDFNGNKFWNVPNNVKPCTIIKFSHFKESEILIGSKKGAVYIIEIQTGYVSGKLKGHTHPVTNITYANDSLCLTSSMYEAMVWDLRNNIKIQVLSLEHSATLKHVAFVPVTTNIVACFNDDLIQIWEFGTFEIKTLIPPVVWFNHELKSITFTVDGRIMVLACRSPHLAVFLLSNYKLLKFITLPEHIQSIKHVEFIPQPTDGGSNKIIAVLSGRGSIYFYNMEENIIISELTSSYEISKFYHSSRGSFIACILCSGDACIYDANVYIMVPIKQKATTVKTPKKAMELRKSHHKIGYVKEQIREILDIEKMRMILRDCGEYPDNYRVTIWERLLELPNNRDLYNAVIDSRMIISFKNLCKKYPLEDKRSLKNLKKLLDNLVTWCQFFYHVDYLPVFVFPFVKVFQNKPLSCFEAVCTIIVNWCQFWFEYFPLPPINVLAMVENLLMEHDPELLNWFMRHNIQSSLYGWPILKSAFSEILTASAWKAFWDHVLTNEPSFLLCAVVAYNILQRSFLLGFNSENQFECFFNTHHPVEVKKLISKTYHVLSHTTEPFHPRQYLSMFKKLKAGEYPDFCAYPKTIVNMKKEQNDALRDELDFLKMNEVTLFRKRLEVLEKLQNSEIVDEEKKRVLAMENAVKKQLLEERENVNKYYERVAQLRNKIHEEDKLLASLKNKISKKQQMSSRSRFLSSVLDDVKLNRMDQDYKMTKAEDELLYHYSELLRNKHKIEKLLEGSVITSTKITNEPSVTFNKHQEELLSEINNIRSTNQSQEHLKVLNLATGIAAMDALIKKIELELEKERRGEVDETVGDNRVMQLQAETKDLVNEVNKLLHLLIEMRSLESG